MSFKAEIGIIGAMQPEVEALVASLKDKSSEYIGGIEFIGGTLEGRKVVIAKCGVGKVFAAMCAEAMIVSYSPSLIINTGVGGATDPTLRAFDVVFADRLIQCDMDTSALGDPVGLISGINKVYFEADARAVEILKTAAEEKKLSYRISTVATSDRFVSTPEDKLTLGRRFGVSACEMEGGAIAQAAYVNGTPFAVIRAISDDVFGNASLDYLEFLEKAAKISSELTRALVLSW